MSFFDQRGFACAEEAGENVDFCHGISLLSLFRGTPWRSPGVPDRWGSPKFLFDRTDSKRENKALTFLCIRNSCVRAGRHRPCHRNPQPRQSAHGCQPPLNQTVNPSGGVKPQSPEGHLDLELVTVRLIEGGNIRQIGCGRSSSVPVTRASVVVPSGADAC